MLVVAEFMVETPYVADTELLTIPMLMPPLIDTLQDAVELTVLDWVEVNDTGTELGFPL
jgi:hypothetical protein